ncbi:hypothetical protein ACFQH6_09610 [Halobacteriaceae archaeon GCM10025711]
MDSVSPSAERIAGDQPIVSGSSFTKLCNFFGTGTETRTNRWLPNGVPGSSSYQHSHHRQATGYRHHP